MKMKALTLEKIAEVTKGSYIGPKSRKNDPITGVSTDSRTLEEGNLFVCIRGKRVDGHNFAKNAAEHGALCRLSEEELSDGYPYILVDNTEAALRSLAAYYRSLFSIPVIGIIGSVGKTTAKELTACVLSRKLCVLKTPANLNNEIGVPLTLLSIREEHEAAVIEMGISDFGEMRVLAEMVRPDICVFTSVGFCHLEKLGDLQGVLRAKSEVFEFMESDAVAIMNGDDELLRDYDPGIRKVLYGTEPYNDIKAENIESLGFDGISCDICMNDMCVFTFIPAFGTHIVYGALAAAAVGKVLGVGGEDILRGIAQYRPVSGRAEVIDTPFITIINDCYNANPNSMSASVRSLCAMNGRRVAILGDMAELGADSAHLHEQIGRLAADRHIDCLITCGKEAGAIHAGYMAARGRNGRYFEDKKKLFITLSSLIKKGDTVLVKASHSMEFDEVISALKKLR